jgi:thioredoxin-like negative regulator of GroEL
MKPIGLATLLLFAGLGDAWAELPAGWNTDYTNSLEQARARNQPLLIYFTASWCGPCRLMARTTLTNQSVVQALANLSHVAIDIDERRQLAEQRGVQAVPTFQLLSPAGDEIASTTGYQESAGFLAWLTNSTGQAAAATLRRQQHEQELAAAEQLFRNGEPGSQEKAVAALLDLCAERASSIREAAAARLAALSTSKPALLLGGLSHHRLAVRICAANLLRARLGDTFDIDPWDDAASRNKAIALWRKKLSSAVR